MSMLTIKVTTDYGTHPVSGAGRIKAVATGHGTRTVRTLSYDHGMSPAMNHQGASYSAVNRAVRKLGFIMEPGNVTRRHDEDGNGHHVFTYTVEV